MKITIYTCNVCNKDEPCILQVLSHVEFAPTVCPFDGVDNAKFRLIIDGKI